MALVQMHNYGNTEAEVKALQEQLELLSSKLKYTENELAEACQQRDTVVAKIQEAIKAIEQRDNSIKKIEEQVKLMQTLAESLKKENGSYRLENAQLNDSLKGKSDELLAVQQDRDRLLSHDEVLAKIDQVGKELSDKLSKLKKNEKAYMDSILKQTNKPADEAYKLKVLSTLNTIDFTTARLRNYNDSKALMKLELMDHKLGELLSGNKIGLLCAFSVVLGVVVGAALMKLM